MLWERMKKNKTKHVKTTDKFSLRKRNVLLKVRINKSERCCTMAKASKQKEPLQAEVSKPTVTYHNFSTNSMCKVCSGFKIK